MSVTRNTDTIKNHKSALVIRSVTQHVEASSCEISGWWKKCSDKVRERCLGGTAFISTQGCRYQCLGKGFLFVSFGLMVKPILLWGPAGGRLPMGEKLQQWALRSYLGC